MRTLKIGAAVGVASLIEEALSRGEVIRQSTQPTFRPMFKGHTITALVRNPDALAQRRLDSCQSYPRQATLSTDT